jgi:DNA-binding SARP family transcriptional activator/tetratricopeptide (TPR) repeat protein
VEFRLLGPVEVHVDGRSVELGRPQLRTVLAALAVEAGQPVSADTLVDRLWDGAPPKGARGVLYTHITRIRRALESAEGNPRRAVLVRRAAGYVLEVDPDNIDLHRFRRLTAAARDVRQADRDRVGLLREALGLWRGTPLAGVRGHWAARSRVGWRQQRLDAAVAWAQAELRLGRGGQVVGAVRELLAEYPLAEPLAGTLMRALATAGRIGEALECYAATRNQLVDELGTEPGRDLQAVHQAILRGELDQVEPPQQPTGQPDEPAPAAAPARPEYPRPAQLPREIRGFTGRQDALDTLDALLDPCDGPLSTVIISAVSGTAGIGKTALAVHWAHRVAHRFPDGQLYVNLRGFDGTGQTMNPAEAVHLFLSALGVAAERIPADPDAQVALYRSLLAGKRVLVVLDNARDPEQVRPLLPGSPAAFVLVTSRNQLTPLVAADGAHPLTLDLLSAVEARTLLERRLGLGRVAAEPAAVEQIVVCCARLPLALSIATARAQQSGFPLAVLAAELADATRRLGVLDAGDPATRVQAVFSWSYQALTAPAARLFRLLGLHPGPDTSVAAAASLAGLPWPAARALLAELTRASLVREQAPGRYTFHDLLAVYAAELCRDTDPEEERQAATGRLLDHYTHTAHTADRLMNPARDPLPLPLAGPAVGTSPEQPADDGAALGWLTVELPVLLAAVRLTAEAGLDQHTWQLAWALDTFLHWRGHWHDRARVWQAAVGAADRLANPIAAAHAHRDLARADNRLGRYDEAHTQLGLALDLFAEAGDPVGQAHTHRTLASLSERQDQRDRALHHDQQALALFRAAGHRQGQADALNSVGWDYSLLGDHAQALAYCQQALTLHRQIGDRWGEATTWDSIGYAHHHLADYREAIDCYQHALVLVRDLGDRFFEADTLGRLGDTHHAARSPTPARAAWQQALAILTDLDHPDADQVRGKLANLNAPG